MKAAQITVGALVLCTILISLIQGNGSTKPGETAIAPGLIGRYYSKALGDEPVCVRIDPGVAFDWTDGMPDDCLPNGDFKVIWEGLLRVPYAGKYKCTALAQGAARVWVEGRQVFPAVAAGSDAAVSLQSGEHPIRVEYDAPAGKAKIHLLWSSDTFAAETINPRYLGHRPESENEIAGQTLEQRGREVVERYGCARCHPIVGVDRSRKPGLPMPHVAHMKPDWIARWVRNPQDVRPGTRMGTPGGKPEDVEVVVSSILSLVQLCDSYGLIDSRWRCGQESDPLDKGNIDAIVRFGRKRFYELGCSACHAPETPKLVDPTRGPSLADIGSKWPKAYLRQLMLDPVARHPTGGMPSNVLEAKDVDGLVAYMSTFRLKPQSGDANRSPTTWLKPPKVHLRPGQSLFHPDVLKEEKAPIRQRFCYACHSPENTPVDGPKLDPQTSRWTAGCLRSDRAASIAPMFTLSAADRAAVVAFLRSRPKEATRMASGEVAQRFIDHTVYCFACHKRDGKGGEPLARTLAHYVPAGTAATPDPISPPDLSGVGARLVHPQMLVTLAGNAPSNRPWLKIKMPGFGLSEAERIQIAARLAVADEIPNLPAPQTMAISKAGEATAPALIGNRGFGCVNCHFLGAKAYQPTNIAPDFTMASRRVSRVWFERWLSNPARIMPGTPMPAFVAPIPGIAGDDLAIQKEIVWRFLQRKAADHGATTTQPK
jgi:mono/diheme cytochrome c family protein